MTSLPRGLASRFTPRNQAVLNPYAPKGGLSLSAKKSSLQVAAKIANALGTPTEDLLE
jgi:hypothetical protein